MSQTTLRVFTLKKLLLLVFSCALPLSVYAQDRTPVQEDAEDVLRISTRLVTVPVIVKTRQGAYIPNLTVRDFRVYEDGLEQNISHFENADQPFTVTIMLDVSDSTRIKLEDIQNAAIAFLDQLKPQDRAVIVAFDKQLVRLTEVTGNRKTLSTAIKRINTGGGTALYDSIDWVINTYLPAISGRKAIVVLTDGIDTSSVRTSYERTIQLANEQYALIYPIQWNTADDYYQKQLAGADSSVVGAPIYTTPKGEPLRKAYERGSRYLQNIAKLSGGRFQHAKSLSDLERSFALIAEELRQQYSLSYYPENRASSQKKRRIKVSVAAPDAAIQFRDSYTQSR